MGEARKDALRLNFDHKLKLEFHGTKLTDRVACGRAFSKSRLHCDEPSVEIQQCGKVLQQARHSGAVN